MKEHAISLEGTPSPWSLLHRAAFWLITLSLLLTLGCKETNVEDVLVWERTVQAEAKMREFILNKENSMEVRQEAINVLIRRGDVLHLPDALSELPPDVRAALIKTTILHLEEMIAPDRSQNSQARAKDGAYYLSLITTEEDDKKRLYDIMVTWVNIGNYMRPDNVSGRVITEKLVEHLGEDAIRIVKPELTKRLNQYTGMILNSREIEKTISKKTLMSHYDKIKGVVEDAQKIKTPEADRMVALLIGEMIKKLAPDLPAIAEFPYKYDNNPFAPNKSTDILLGVARFLLVDKAADYSYRNTEVIKKTIITGYFPDVIAELDTDKKPHPLTEAINICQDVVRSDQPGSSYLRWHCVDFIGSVQKNSKNIPQNLSKDGPKDVISFVLDHLPDNPEVLHLPDDYPYEDEFGGLDPESFLIGELLGFCVNLNDYYKESGQVIPKGEKNPKVPTDLFRERLQESRKDRRKRLGGDKDSHRTFDQLLSILCLDRGAHGTKDDIALLRAFAKTHKKKPLPINEWRVGFDFAAETLPELATQVAERLEKAEEERKVRVAVLKENISPKERQEALSAAIQNGYAYYIPKLLFDLPIETREKIVANMTLHFEKKMTPDSALSFHVKAKDGAYFLSLMTEKKEFKKRLYTLIIHQYIEMELKAKKDGESLSEETLQDYHNKIGRVVLDVQRVQTEEGSRMIAQLMGELIKKLAPDLPWIARYPYEYDNNPFKPNKSIDILLPIARSLLLEGISDPANGMYQITELIKTRIIKGYFLNVVAKIHEDEKAPPLTEAVNICQELIQSNQVSVAYLRWRCLNFLGSVQNNPKYNAKDVINFALDHVPDDPQILHLSDKHPFNKKVGGNINPTSFLFLELRGFCTDLKHHYKASNKALPIDLFRERLQESDDARLKRAGNDKTPRIFDQLLSILCLDKNAYGTKEDAVLLREFAKRYQTDPPSIGAWRVGLSFKALTLPDLAIQAAERLDPPASPPGETSPAPE